MHHITKILTTTAIVALFAGCASKETEWHAPLTKAGFVPFNQPTGDTRNIVDWKKYGPGAIAKLKSAKLQEEPYYWATFVIGEEGVRAAMDRSNSSPIHLNVTKKTVKGWQLDGKGGWTLEGVNKIAGVIGIKKDTTVELTIGNTFKASPMDQGTLHERLAKTVPRMTPDARKGIRAGELGCVQNVIWTDSIRYTFKTTGSHNESITYKLSSEEIAKLEAKGNKVVEGGIEVREPAFIAFTPLPNAGAQ